MPMGLAWARADPGLALPCPAMFLTSRLPPTGSGLGHRVRRRLFRPLFEAELIAVLKRLSPALVHAHFGFTGARIVRACKGLEIPLVVSFYGYDAGSGSAATFGELFDYASAAIGEGPALVARLQELGARPGSTRLLPLCLPRWALEEPEPRAPRHGPLRLLQIARFVEKKGFPTTLKALSHARRLGVDARLILAGTGPLEQELRSLVKQLGLSDLVEFAGFVPYSDLKGLLAETDVLVQPSQTTEADTEGGAPTVLIEAQSQLVPILGTRHADIPFVVEDERTGLLTPERDHVALAENLARFASSPSLLKEFGSLARERVLDRHHPARLLPVREDIYWEAGRTG
jgi:colanic acid/amylovoran biosynthesis glycosyltransferase